MGKPLPTGSPQQTGDPLATRRNNPSVVVREFAYLTVDACHFLRLIVQAHSDEMDNVEEWWDLRHTKDHVAAYWTP